jgi:hypothetical protein
VPASSALNPSFAHAGDDTPTMPTKQHTMPTTPKTEESKTNPINYTVERLKDGTARLLVEQTPVPGPLTRPVAVRYLIDDHGEPVIRRGALLGYDRINPSLLFLIVRAGDLISLGKRTIGEASTVWTHYKVGRGFRLMEIDIKGRRLSYAEIRSRVGPYRLLEQPSECDDSLREFLSDSDHPKWMLPILERQKRKWRANHPSKYYHLVPSEIKESEIRRVVKIAPGAAIRFLLPKLTKIQTRSCIRRALATAVIHAYDEIPPTQLKTAIRDYPGLLLKHQGKRIPVDMLMHCVRIEPFEAFVIRKQFPPDLHAKILAETCVLPFQLFKSGNISRLPAEIETSFRRYPVEWIEIYHNDFSKLFRVLERHGRMKMCPKLLNFLKSSLPPEYRPSLFKFIANQL